MSRRYLGIFKIDGGASGGETFVRRTEAMLLDLLSSSAGAALLRCLRAARRKVRIRPFDGARETLNALYNPYDGGPGTRRRGVYYSAELFPRAFAPVANLIGWEYHDLDRVLWRDDVERRESEPPTRSEVETRLRAQQADGACALFHELVHAYRDALGVDRHTASENMGGRGGFPNTRELAAVLFENCLRAERGLPMRISHDNDETAADCSAIWSDPPLAELARLTLEQTPDLTAAMRALPLSPHPLMADGGAAARGLFGGSWDASRF